MLCGGTARAKMKTVNLPVFITFFQQRPVHPKDRL
jgi:hypothetical protein